MLNKIALPANLPRDARDTLFLLAVIAWVMLMQVQHIPWWCSALTAGVLLWRASLALRGKPLPGWPWRVGLLLVTVTATWFTHKTLVGRDAGVTLIVVLLALKTLELRARRDAFVVFFLGFFTLLTHFFYSQSLLTAAGILVALLGLLTAVVNAHMPVGRPPLLQMVGIAARMAALGTPIMFVAFMLFPRLSPLWGMPGDASESRMGLSANMRVGQLAELALDERIALRVRFDGAPPAQRDLYFRGPVLTTFDGVEWKPLQSAFPAHMELQAELKVAGAPVRYEVTMEPTMRPWLLMLEATTTAPDLPNYRPFMTPELQWLTRRPITELLRYRAESHTDFRHGPLQPSVALADQTALPPGFNPRTMALAQSMRREVGTGPQSATALVDAALTRLRTGGYSYALDPGVYGRHTADEFWFDRKEGFCEHIASSFVILMRALDIPARIVTGYQGGELNVVDGYWVVRQRDAHAWAEVWLEGRGWVRVDPTGAVAPGRTGSMERLRTPEGAIATALGTIDPTLVQRMRDAWDAVNNGWNQWVLNYTQGRQLDLLKNLGFESPSWTDLAYVLIGVIVAVSLAGAAWTLWERQQHDPWLRALARVRRRLTEAGLTPTEHSTPRELARVASAHFGDNDFTRQLGAWLLRLEALRYAPRSGDTLESLQSELRQITWPARATR
ncbi:transglutaminaseTgpA domain-containing protein [Hydrogenophaga sp. RWCD_12]|uniref:transglutaminase family protein n=1 Tax=Hydrogenophaga sp. RWCD_12 TaxID=3391190 RepID=UPI00398567A5